MPAYDDRGLSTARAVLRLLTYVAQHPSGVTAREVAETLGRSLSTAYHLLASLEAEGFVARDGRTGRHRLVATVPGAPAPVPVALDEMTPEIEEALRDGMREVFRRTGRRTCIGVFCTGGVQLVEEIGRQGMPRMGNLEKPTIRHTAHALAIGKLALAGLNEEQLQRYEDESGLRSFTAITVTDPYTLRRELAEVRRRGVACDRCEYDVDFGCFAAPVHGADGRPIAALGITVTRPQFAAERDALQSSLLEVTRALDRRPRPVPGADEPVA